jgi:hypothetical protein
MPTRPSARTWRITAAVGFWALIALAIIVRGDAGLVLAYAAGAWLLAFSLLAWRRQDEYARAAQKFSWIFGGLSGLFVSLAFLPLLLQPEVLTPLVNWIGAMFVGADGVYPDPAFSALLLGAIWIVTGQLVGFLVCWVGWHFAKR